jgi:hypothetical protein
MDFGDTRSGDRVELQEDLGPKTEFEAEMDLWWELLGDISQDLERLEGELANRRMESQALEKAGMYPAIPTESWQPRNGKGNYLRMVFPRGTPGVQRKEYVGNKPEAITEARRLAANRRRWEELERASTQVEAFLGGIRYELGTIAGRLARYQVPDLGTPAGLVSAGDVPKIERMNHERAI